MQNGTGENGDSRGEKVKLAKENTQGAVSGRMKSVEVSRSEMKEPLMKVQGEPELFYEIDHQAIAEYNAGQQGKPNQNDSDECKCSWDCTKECCKNCWIGICLIGSIGAMFS